MSKQHLQREGGLTAFFWSIAGGTFCLSMLLGVNYLLFSWNPDNWPLPSFAWAFPLQQALIAILYFFWGVIAGTLPFLVIVTVAKRFSFMSAGYYIACSPVIAAFISLLSSWLFRRDNAAGETPALWPTSMELFLKLLLPSLCAALIYWYRSGRFSESTTRPG